ncbi:MAG: VCBS repeat-containing protein [Myxococcales bacterium]
MTRAPTLFLALFAALSCSDGRTREHTEPDPYCGDGKKNAAEKCDATDLGGETCASLGYLSGSLVCAEDCTFDAIGCSRTCGNATVDPGETCDGANLDGKDCAKWGRTSCDGGCRLVQSCVDAPLIEAQRQSFRTQPYAHLAPRAREGVKSVELFVVQPGDDRIDLQRFDKDKGFLADRVLAFEPGTLVASATLVADLTGDGSADVAVASASEVLFKVAGDNGFATKTAAVSCSANPRATKLASGELAVLCSDGGASWLIPFRYDQGSFNAAARVELETTDFESVADLTGDGRADLLVRTAAHSIKVLEGDGSLGFAFAGKEWATGLVAGAFTTFDANGDGRTDVVVEGGTLLVQQADRSFQAATVAGAGGLPVDLDGDGRIDLLSVEPGTMRAWRNSGALDFSRLQELALGLASVALVSVGDVQLDEDLDVVVSGATPAGQFQVVWYRNPSR